MNTSREIPASVDEVFAAFTDPQRLARWWGPAGFTNTFHTFEFESGGRWIYTMHGPDGRDYPNESIFQEILPERKVLIEHVVLPIYRLEIAFMETDGNTTVTWEQDFENHVFAAKMKDFLETANEQNLDRLTAEVIRSRMDQFLFVYGHLRKNGEASLRNTFAGSKFVGDGSVHGKLFDLGDYPALLLHDADDVVLGEVYEIDAETLVALDEFESTADYHRREAVVFVDDKPLTCWIYSADPERCYEGQAIDSGDWIEYSRNR